MKSILSITSAWDEPFFGLPALRAFSTMLAATVTESEDCERRETAGAGLELEAGTVLVDK